jgi:HEXXH motif-containing protein
VRTTSSNPWAWQPGKAAWFRLLEARAALWRPALGVPEDVGAVRSALVQAARGAAAWLYDPAVAAVLAPRDESSYVRDVQLMVLLACHDLSLAPCRVALPAATSLYLGTRLAFVGPGTVTLGDLAERREEPPAALGQLDFCAHTVAAEDHDLWRRREEIGDDRVRALQSLLAEVRAVLERLPACRSWLEPIFRVVVPTKSEDSTQSSSRSYEFFPGVVFADWQSGLESAVEAVVHETAHHYFHLHELGGHLVSPAYKGLAWSPLARRHRPLTRVLLAYHAVAYMACLHQDWLDTGTVDPQFTSRVLAALRAQSDAYQHVIAGERRHLTERGRRFSDATTAVAEYGFCSG